MAIQPIDLQTMYSHMGNVAKQAAHAQQGVQLSQSMNQVEVIKQNAENASKVQKTNNGSKSGAVDEDGRNKSDPQQNDKDDEKRRKEDSHEISKSYGLSESYLGVHIDISR